MSSFSAFEFVMPVWNEAANIGSALAEIEDKVDTPHKILVVYDMPDDNNFQKSLRWVGPTSSPS